jgi:hypothetical protein
MVARGGLSLGFMLAASLLPCAPTYSQVPCDFKGVSVGDKMTREQLMQRLGIAKFKLDPAEQSLVDLSLAKKYSAIPAGEIQYEKTGPFCSYTFCSIPYGLTVGNDSIPVKVSASFKNGIVSEIDVSFSMSSWDKVFYIIKKKYGSDWDIQRRPTVVMDYQTKKVMKLELISATHRYGGRNSLTNDSCRLRAQNIDLIFEHHDSLGPLHSVFWIKRERDAKGF